MLRNSVPVFFRRFTFNLLEKCHHIRRDLCNGLKDDELDSLQVLFEHMGTHLKHLWICENKRLLSTVDDDDVYKWGGGSNTLLKVTKDLVRWAKDANGFMERMQRPEHTDDLVRLTKQKRAAEDALFETIKKIRADPSQATIPDVFDSKKMSCHPLSKC